MGHIECIVNKRLSGGNRRLIKAVVIGAGLVGGITERLINPRHGDPRLEHAHERRHGAAQHGERALAKARSRRHRALKARTGVAKPVMGGRRRLSERLLHRRGLRSRSLVDRSRLRRRGSTDHRLAAVAAKDGAIGLLGTTVRTEHFIPLS